MLSICVFLLTILCIIIRPFGLGIGTIAVIGAFVDLLFGVVSFKDILNAASIVWDASLAFLGIIIFSIILDEIGFFEHAAYKTSIFCGGNLKRLFIGLMVLCGIISALFANDAAVLILSPIILAQARILNLSQNATISLLLAIGFMSDSASLPFVFSNLTNIITAGFFNISFLEYFFAMSLPFLISFISSIVVAFFIIKKSLNDKINISALKSNFTFSLNKQLYIFSWIFLALLLCGYALGDIYKLPFCIFALGGALIFMLIALKLNAIKAKVIFTRTPWQILWFSLGLYIIVWGLKNDGYSQFLEQILRTFQSEFGLVFASGFISSILSSLMNNLPAMMLMDLSLQNLHSQSAIYASIVGCNVGVKLTPFGSLATLLWLYTLRAKGVNISIKTYLIFSFKITFIVLSLTLLGVYFWI